MLEFLMYIWNWFINFFYYIYEETFAEIADD